MKQYNTFTPMMVLCKKRALRVLKLFILLILFRGVAFAQTHAIADSLWKIAEAAEKEEKWAISAIYFEKSADAEKACDIPRLEDLYYELSRASNAYALSDDTKKALFLRIESYTLSKTVFGSEHANVGWEAFWVGLLLVSFEENAKALPYYIEALENAEKTLGKDHPDYLMRLNKLADLYHTMGLYEKALPLNLEALEKTEKSFGREHSEYGTRLNNLALLYETMGQYEKALPLYLEALKYTEKSLGREHSYYGNQLSNLAVLYKVVGEYDKALPLSLQAIENAEKSLGKEHSEYSTRLNNLAGLYEAMGHYDKALPLYLQAIENAEKSLGREHSKYGTLLNNLAGLYKTMGQYEKALPMYLQALDITEKSLGSGHAEYGIRLNNLAGLYEAVGEYEKALPLYLQALDITEKSLGSGHSEYGSHLNNLAGIYKELGQYDKALALYLNALENTDKSLGREHSEYGKFLNNLAGLYETMGQYEKALPLYRESLEITEKGLGKQHSNYSIRLNNLAGLYETMGQYEKALPLYLEAYQNIKSQIAQQFRFMSEKEKEQFLRGVMYYFEIYHSFLLDYPVKDAIVCGFSLDIELTRKSLLLQSSLVMRQAVQQSNDSALLSQYEAWLFAKDLIAKEYGLPAKDRRADLNDMESKAEQMEAELTRKSSALKVALQKGQTTWQEVKLSLPEKTIAIELISFNCHNNNAWTDSTLYMAIVLRKSDTMPHMIPLFEQRQLDSLLTRQNKSEQGFVSGLYRGIKTNSSQQDVYQGRKLFELIWKPLDSLLQPGDNIYLAPSGTLHQLAFAAIPYDSSTTLSDRYRLHTVASTAVLLKEKNSTQARTLSVFGGVQFDDSDTTATNANTSTVSRSLPGDLQRSGETWSYLPGTLREAESIATTAKQKGIQVTLFSGKAATEEKLKALTGKNAPDVLHIATHGFFFPDPKEKPVDDGFISDKQETVFKASDNPLNRSGIVLAGANKTWNGAEKPDGREDGILTAYEASYLPLANTKLVVLSACETGLGDVKGSEGVYGLQRAFKQAGAEYLLMSLWKVPDNETAEFMSTFYGHYFGGSSIEDAYLLTQKAMREKYRNDPYKWAAFVLMR